jgi:tetratricopeptide (TPR) repeat protein
MTYDDYADELAGLLHCGKLCELIARSQEIVEKFRFTFGEGHEQTANARGGLAFAYFETGDWDTAAAHWSRVCEIHLANFGQRSPHYVNSLCDLARADLLAGRIDKAETLVDRATTILPSLPGDQRDILIVNLVLRARLRVRRKDTNAAGEILLDAVRLRLRQLEGEFGGSYNWKDRVLSDIFAHLSLVYVSCGNLRAANGALQKALRIRQTEYDNKYPYYARMLSTLGEIQRRQGHIAAANASQATALKTLRRLRPEGHFDIKLVERRLADLEIRENLS